MDRPRAVMVVGKLPEPVQGGLDLRIKAQLAGMAQSCDVTVIALHGPPKSELDPVTGMHNVCLAGNPHVDQHDLVINALANPDDPYRPVFDQNLARALVSQVTAINPDIVIVSRLQSWIYASHIKQATRAPLVLDLDESAARLLESFRDLPYFGLQRSLHLRFTRAVAEFERRVVNEPDAIWVASEMEKQFVRDRYPGVKRVDVVVNAISGPESTPARAASDHFEVLFPSNFAYPPNLLAAREIIDEIAPRQPSMHFTLAGANAPGSLAIDLPPNVTVISPVADMSTLLARADAAVLPIRAGGGTRLKALECMAWGIPVIATKIAMEGLQVRPGMEFLHAETTDEFIHALDLLRTDEQVRATMIDLGRHLASNRHSVDAVAHQIRWSLDQIEEQ